MAGPEGADEVAAVVVTYHPDPEVRDRLETVAGQVGRVVVVDNGSAEEDRAPIARWTTDRPRALLVRLPENRGVGRALNEGAKRAIEEGAEWLLFLDQDTEADRDLFGVLSEAAAALPSAGKLAVLGANYREGEGGPTRLERDGLTAEGPALERPTVITAGSLVPVPVWTALGGFREELFVDHVDDDFCLRARARGLRVWMTRRPAMTHAIGEQSRHRLPWRWTATSNHGPLRRYYQTRNHLVLLAEHGLSERRWAARSLLSRLKALALMLLFEEQRTAKLREALRGVSHALRGRLGPHPRQEGGRDGE